MTRWAMPSAAIFSAYAAGYIRASGVYGDAPTGLLLLSGALLASVLIW